MGCLTTKTSGKFINLISPTVTPIESAKVYFSPTQLGEGTPSPENVREIVGRTSVELTHTGTKYLGKNLLYGEKLLDNAQKYLPSGIVNTDEQYFRFSDSATLDNTYRFSDGVSFKANTQYTFIITVMKPSGTGTNLRIYYTDGTYQNITVGTTDIKTTVVAVSKKGKTVHNLAKTNSSSYTLIYYNECGIFEGVHTLAEFQDGTLPYQNETVSFSWKRLPDEYQEVEYIENDGTSYLDLNYVPIGDEKFKLLFSYITTPSISKSYLQLFGCREVGASVSNKNCWLGIDSSNILYSRFGTVNIEDSILVSKGKHTIIVDLKNTCLSIDNNNYYFNNSIISDINMSIYLGYMHAPTSGMSLNPSGIGQYNNFIIYNNNNEVIHNFIPCYRKSDNEIGMYDTVSQTFYTNQGTGTFTKGDDVFSDEVYGGYVDLVKGEIVQTMVYYDLGNFDWAKADKEFRTHQAISAKAPSGQNVVLPSTLCNAYPIIPANKTGAGVHQQYDGIAINTDGHIWGYDTDLFNGTAEEYKQAMTGIKIVCERNTPITHPLPDYLKTQLQTLKNENYFWSDADSVEIEYGLAETFDIQKAKRKIIMNQPHVETVTGDAVSFTTDMKAPLKECKVSFMPVQEGSGDPSPTNVRNIVGWNGVTVTGGLPSEYQEVEYIENTGEQYLLTDFIYRKDLDNPKIEWKYSQIVSPSGQDSMLFGYTVDGGAVYYECYNTSTRIYGGVGGNRYSKIEITSSASLGNIAICSMTKTILQVNNSTYGYSGTYADLTTVNPMSIFAWTDKNGVSVNYINKGARLYYLRFYNNDTKMAEFIPCYRKSDNEIGMYDTVSKQFYTNQGTGTFEKGNDINNIFIDADFKSVTELKNKFNGNIMWNQLLPSTEKSGSHTPVGTQKYDTYRGILEERLTVGHIYFIWATFTYNGDRTDIRPYMQQSTSQNYVRGGASRFFNLNGIGHEMEFGGFVKVTNAGNVILGITTNQANLTEEWSYDNLMLIDCTVAFGEEIANYYLNAPQYEAQAWFRNLFPDIYYEYNTGESIAKEFYWGDGITYGGYIDLVSGKLVDEWECVDLSTITPRVRYTGDVNKTISLQLPSSFLSYPLSSFKTMKCSMYKYIKSVTEASILSSPDKYDIGLYVYCYPSAPITSTVYFVLPIETQLSGYLTYCSSKPITYQLTPQQLITLKGQNNIWADTNGTTDIKYWTH